MLNLSIPSVEELTIRAVSEGDTKQLEQLRNEEGFEEACAEIIFTDNEIHRKFTDVYGYELQSSLQLENFIFELAMLNRCRA